MFHDYSLCGKSWRCSAVWRGGPEGKATVVASLSADNHSKGEYLTVGGRSVSGWLKTPAQLYRYHLYIFCVRSVNEIQRYSLLIDERFISVGMEAKIRLLDWSEYGSARLRLVFAIILP